MRAGLYDAATRLMLYPGDTTPGMDTGYFRALDMEADWPGDRVQEMNDLIRTTPITGTYRPWPVPFPWRSWIDVTPRYERQDGGFTIQLFHHDVLTGEYEPVPADVCAVEVGDDYDPLVSRESERMATELDQDEIQARNPSPTEWLRLPLGNESGGRYGGLCDLRDPAVMVQRAHTGPEFAWVADYNPLFAPVDLRHPEWYDVLDENGVQVGESEKLRHMRLHDGGQYRIYLRPANWRWATSVRAVYLYVSWFEMFLTPQIFFNAWHDRPPIYPYRHDFLHTTQVADWYYNGAYYSTDPGINEAFNSSRGAGHLRAQIVDAQWWTLSEAYIFHSNDEAIVTLWMYPPESGDIVCGVTRVDQPSGEEQTVWVRQNRDLTSEYPRTVIGSYAIWDFVVAT